MTAPGQLMFVSRMGLGSGFSDHMLLQYQLSSSPRYTAFAFKEKDVGPTYR